MNTFEKKSNEDIEEEDLEEISVLEEREVYNLESLREELIDMIRLYKEYLANSNGFMPEYLNSTYNIVEKARYGAFDDCLEYLAVMGAALKKRPRLRFE